MHPDTGVHEETASPQTGDSCPVGNPEAIFIGRTEYKISMIDTKRRERQWNATFIDYSSHLLPGELIAAVFICLVDDKYPFQHFHSAADGKLVTIDAATSQVRWRKDFRSVIVNLYLLKHDGMHRIPSTSVGQTALEMLQKVGLFILLLLNWNCVSPAGWELVK